ncbi:MAG: hypothetical protein V2A72_01050, partial [Candidatus Omnitrophota bacterium]
MKRRIFKFISTVLIITFTFNQICYAAGGEHIANDRSVSTLRPISVTNVGGKPSTTVKNVLTETQKDITATTAEQPITPPKDPKKKSMLERGWVVGVHIFVALYMANITSLFNLFASSKSTFSKRDIFGYILSPMHALVTIGIWIASFIISTGWHERGHFLKAIKVNTLKSNDILQKQLDDERLSFEKEKHSFIMRIL